MGNVSRAPVASVTRCVSILYAQEEISANERSELLGMIKEAMGCGDWLKLRERLFGLREKSCVKRVIDTAIDATR